MYVESLTEEFVYTLKDVTQLLMKVCNKKEKEKKEKRTKVNK